MVFQITGFLDNQLVGQLDVLTSFFQKWMTDHPLLHLLFLILERAGRDVCCHLSSEL